MAVDEFSLRRAKQKARHKKMLIACVFHILDWDHEYFFSFPHSMSHFDLFVELCIHGIVFVFIVPSFPIYMPER